MKETIEWFKTTDINRPYNGEEVLMKLGPNRVDAGVFYTASGFTFQCGDSADPIMWCYFPKGTK